MQCFLCYSIKLVFATSAFYFNDNTLFFYMIFNYYVWTS